MAIPTCLLLSLLCGWRLGAARTWGLSVVCSLLSVILSPGGTVVRLGAWGSSRTSSGGHLSCMGPEGEWLGMTMGPTPPQGPPAHPASCSTLPRPWCSPAAGVLPAAGVAGLREASAGGQHRDEAPPTPLADLSPCDSHILTNFFIILFPSLGVVRLAGGWGLWGLTLGWGGCGGWRGARHRAWGLLVVV